MVYPFDLQLFAEEAEADAGNETGAETAGEAPQSGTILGAARGNETQAETTPGVPENYDFRDVIPEGLEYDESQAAAYGAIAKECGLTQEQASKLAAYGIQYAQGGVQAAVAAHQAMVSGWADTARTELAGDYDKTVAMAARGIRAAETKVPGIRQMLDETGAGNRIEMIRMLAELGALTGEDSGHTGGSVSGGTPSIYPNTDYSRYF